MSKMNSLGILWARNPAQSPIPNRNNSDFLPRGVLGLLGAIFTPKFHRL